MSFSKMMINRSHHRSTFVKLLETLIRLGFNNTMMSDAFPDYKGIDNLIFKYAKELDSDINFH